MDRPRATIELIGVTVVAPEPVGPVEFRFQPGVDVLYGRNGAGKTRFLQGMLDAIGAGTSDAVGEHLVHARVGPGGDPVLAASVENALYSPAVRDAPWESETVDVVRCNMGRTLFHMIAPYQDPADLSWTEQLVWELVEPGYLVFHLIPSGSWWLNVGGRLSEAGPLLHGFLRAGFDDDLGPPEIDSRVVRAWNASLEGEDFSQRLVNHPWACAPVFTLGTAHVRGRNTFEFADSTPFMDVVTEDDSWDPDVVTARQGVRPAEFLRLTDAIASQATAAELVAELQRDDSADPADLLAVLQRTSEDLAERANRFYGCLLADAPRLRIQFPPLYRQLAGAQILRWIADVPTGSEVPVSSLSAAQRRWARLAIRLALGSALDQQPGGILSTIVVLDEPENALPPTAQRFLADGLNQIADEEALQIVVASHSPALLRRRDMRLHHVRRGTDRRVVLEPMPTGFATGATDLGLDPADLIQLTRVFVLVEGRHDELVLNTLFAEDLDALAARVFAFRGVVGGLSGVLDARFLFDFTDATALVVVDNAASANPGRLWAEARNLTDRGHLPEGRELMANALKNEIPEQAFLKEFGIRALEHHSARRIEVHALAAPDVLDLLPIEVIAPGARGLTWPELRAHPDAPTSSGKFKEWARKHFDLRDDDETIRAATVALGDSIPDDLLAVLRKVEGMSANQSDRG